MSNAPPGGLAWMATLALVIGACAGTPATPAPPTAATTPTSTEADQAPTPDSGVATPAANGHAGSGAGTATVEIAGQVYLLAGNICSLDPPVLDLASPTGLVSLNATTGISSVTTLTLETEDGGVWYGGGQQLFVGSGSMATFSGTLSDPASGREEQATITVICGDIS